MVDGYMSKGKQTPADMVAERMRNQPRVTVVAIGIASSGRACPLELVIAMTNQTYPVNTGVGWSVVVGADVDVARERIVEGALKFGAKYIWFVDDDTVPPFDAARKLLYVLQQEEAKGSNVKVCGGIVCYKRDPPEPLLFLEPNGGTHWKWKAGDIFKVWGLGMGCTMIKADVFKHLKKPWFKFVNEPNCIIGEDLYFCEQVNKAGFGVMAHGGVLCRHWDMAEPKAYELPKDSYPMLADDTEKRRGVALVANHHK